MKGVRVRAVLALGAVLSVAVGSTFAYWSDSAVVSGVTITSGSLDLKVDDQDSLTYTDLNLSGMVPGNSTAGILRVSNDGSVPFTYYADATASGALGSALVAKITEDTGVTGTSPTETCAGTAVADSGTSFSDNLLSQSNPLTLDPGDSQTFCIQASLPTDASTTLQGATTNITVTFNADQVH